MFNLMCLLFNFVDYLLIALNFNAPIYEPVTYSDATNPKSTKMGKYSTPERVMLILTSLFLVFSTVNMYVIVFHLLLFFPFPFFLFDLVWFHFVFCLLSMAIWKVGKSFVQNTN